MPKNIIFVKGVVDSDSLLPLNVNRETLQGSNIIKAISKKLVRKTIDMLCKQADKEESNKEKYDGIDDNTKEVEINEVADMDDDKLFVDAAKYAPPPQDDMTTTTAAAAEDGGDNNVGAEDSNDNDEADNTKGG